MHIDACKEFYKNLTVVISEKKEIATTQVRGVKIELDGMTLAGVLGVPSNNGICEYIKEVLEESVYCKPLEIIMKFANNDMITEARRTEFERAREDRIQAYLEKAQAENARLLALLQQAQSQTKP
ncbi:hypothetical protein Dimus_015303 [Dionaea muscipula]